MMTTMTMYRDRTPAMAARDTGMTARVALAWAMAGGVLAGGFLVGFMTLAGRLNANGVLVTATGLFLLGTAAGFAVGGVIGWFGRPADVTAAEAVGGLFRAVAYAVPALLVAFLATGWMAATVMVLYAGAVVPMVLAAGAWVTGAAVVMWAAVETAAVEVRLPRR
jgi:hypothetical protein